MFMQRHLNMRSTAAAALSTIPFSIFYFYCFDLEEHLAELVLVPFHAVLINSAALL